MIDRAAGRETLGRVLVVDDHARARESMADILRCAGHRVQCCSSAIEALRVLDDTSFDVILTDLKMPGMNGLEFIRTLQQRTVESQVVMVTAHASVTTAVDAMRRGAFDYIEKPFDADQLETLVDRALRNGDGNRSSVPAEDGPVRVTMIGESQPMQLLRQQIAQAAPSQETVLVTGESGTGKELVARTIHASSRCARGPFVGVNCPALSPQLMESELFGHERGAFTSADAPRVGRFELADGGSLLLDEVTEIPPPLQAKLLRVLQEQSFERLGCSETLNVSVRVLATTNRDIRQEVAAGAFRQDLYFRLAVIPIHVPPLRQRKEDIPALADAFLRQAAERLQRPPCQLDQQARDLLVNHHWPGNVRELENIVTRASVLNSGQSIGADQLRPWLIDPLHEGLDPSRAASPHDSLVAGMSLQDMERKLIEATLEHFDGHRGKTAQALGIGVRTLANKMRSYGYAPRTKVFSRSA